MAVMLSLLLLIPGLSYGFSDGAKGSSVTEPFKSAVNQVVNTTANLSFPQASADGFSKGDDNLLQSGDDEELVRASLLTESAAIMPGGTVLAGVRLQMAEGWYVYWKNPGDSGIPTSVKWELPEGFSSSELMWPWPGSFYTDSFVSYGYKEEVVLFTELKAPDGAETGSEVTISASVTWLVCKDICIPGSAEVSESVRVTERQPGIITGNEALFDSFRLRLPVSVPGLEAAATEDDRSIVLHLKHDGLRNADVNNLVFYCSEEGVVESGAEQYYEITENGLRIELQKSAFIGDDISKISGVLYNAGGWGGNGMKALSVTAVLSDN